MWRGPRFRFCDWQFQLRCTGSLVSPETALLGKFPRACVYFRWED